MTNFWKNIVRLVFSGVLLIPLTFWVNRFHIFSKQWDLPSKGDLNAFTFSLLIIFGVIVLYQFVMVVLDMFTQKTNASPFVKSFAQLGLIRFLLNRYRAIRSLNTKSKISFALFGTFIFGFVSILIVTHVFDKQSLLFYDVINRSRMNIYDSSKVVYYFNYFTNDNNTEKYVLDLFKLAKDFKKVDVKAVVTDWPVNISAKDVRLRSILDSLIRNYDIIFANYPNGNVHKYLPPPFFRSANMYLGFPVYSTEDVQDNENNLRTIVPWYPYRIYRLTATDAGFFTESDVALSVAEKYFSKQNYSSFENHQIAIDGHQIVSKNFRIPIISEGVAYSKMRWDWLRNSPVSASHGVGGWYEGKKIPDSLVYHFQVESENSSYTSDQDTLQNFLPFEKYFKNKIVIINWIDASNNRTRDMLGKYKVGSIINATIFNQNYTRIEIENYIISFLFIAFIGILFFRLRSLYVLTISLCLIFGTIGIGIWLFIATQCIFDVIYPIVAIILSVLIFWLLKLAHEVLQ